MSKSFQFKLMFKGVILAGILALLLSLIFGLLVAFTPVPESDLAITIIFAASIFIAAFLVSHHSGTKGLYYGLAIGINFIILLLLFTAIFSSVSPSWLKLGERTIFALVSGGAGGIIGVLFHRS